MDPKALARFKFHAYSFVEHLAWGFAAVLPPFARTIVFRLVFRKFGRGTFIHYGVYVRYPFKVTIGQGTVINPGCRLYPSFHVREAEIIIGDDVSLGPDVRIFSATHDHRTMGLIDEAGTVIIGDHAWIGGASIILPGVTVGEGAVVGAGSVVTRSLPPWTIAVGNPARVIKQRVISPPAEASPGHT